MSDERIPSSSEINADELSEWEANSRYGHSMVATREKIVEMLEMLDPLLEEVRSKEVELQEKASKQERVNHVENIDGIERA